MLDSSAYTSLQITWLHKQPPLYGVGPSRSLWVHSTHTVNMKVLGSVAWTMEWLQAFSFCFWKGSVSWVNWQCSWVLRPRGVNVPRPTTALVGTQMIFFLFSFSCLKSTDSAFLSRNDFRIVWTELLDKTDWGWGTKEAAMLYINSSMESQRIDAM